jgi:hypothetical protein
MDRSMLSDKHDNGILQAIKEMILQLLEVALTGA